MFTLERAQAASTTGRRLGLVRHRKLNFYWPTSDTSNLHCSSVRNVLTQAQRDPFMTETLKCEHENMRLQPSYSSTSHVNSAYTSCMMFVHKYEFALHSSRNSVCHFMCSLTEGSFLTEELYFVKSLQLTNILNEVISCLPVS